MLLVGLEVAAGYAVCERMMTLFPLGRLKAGPIADALKPGSGRC